MNMNNIHCHDYVFLFSWQDSMKNKCQCNRNVGRQKTCSGLTIFPGLVLATQRQCTTTLPLSHDHFHMQACTCKPSCKPALTLFQRGAPKRYCRCSQADSELPKDMFVVRHAQLSSFQIRRASSTSTRWCGGEFTELCLDFKPHNRWLAASLVCLRIITLAEHKRL